MADPTTPDIHYQTVSQRVPQWLVNSTAPQRQALRRQVPQPMPWLADAGFNLPDVVNELREEHQRHQFHEELVADFLKQLPSVEAFAEPLLRDALQRTFNLNLDVRHTFLFNAARARVDEAQFNASDPLVKAFQVVKAATQPLLLAALQNFEAFEAEADGMRDDRQPSTIFISETGLPLEPGRNVDLVPERFAALCRELDLGGQYQRLIASVFEPQPKAGESGKLAVENRQGLFKLAEQSAFRVNLHLAYLQSWLGQTLYDDLLEVAKNGRAKGTLRRSLLTLWDVELNGIVLFHRAPEARDGTAPLVVYMPDEPTQPFQEFKHFQAFHASLRQRLREPAWRDWFLRFIPARERNRLLRHIHDSLNPKVWNPSGWYEERPDPKATLRLGKNDFAAPLFDVLLQRKIAVLKDDGLFHAVPTAQEDHKSAEDKRAYFLGVAFNVANVAAFVVPGLGEVMLAVNAAMLGYEVYEGFDALSKDEREQAWGYFLDVGENLATLVALGAVGAGAERFTSNLPLAVRAMRPVTLADGSVRLWKPDLAPFAWDVRLPADLPPGDNGLYDHQGRQWLKLEGQYYSVRTLMGAEQGYSLEHPARPWAYEPDVRHNGNGGWLHELDTPQQWQGVELFRRQGHREAGISEQVAQRALQVSGISEAQLRQTLIDSRRPPALLTDTLRRLTLADSLGNADAEAFAAGYRALQPRLSSEGQVLQRQFDLPDGIVEEIVGAATGHEIDEITHSRRVPQRLAEEARSYQQQVRLARACEGLYLDVEANVDSARLLLHGLERLPDWPADLRIGLYDGSPEGPLLASIGSGDAPQHPLIWREQLPRGFCQTLFDAIPEETRARLGLDSAAGLRARLQEQGFAPRQRLREWLGMQAIKPGFRSPMRLADGQLGYPLSGRGHGNPYFTEDELLDKLRLLELDDLYVEDALAALYRSGLNRPAISARLDRLLGELLLLRERLDRWVMESAREPLGEARQRSRERIGQSIWDYWRRGLLPELGRPAPRLVLWQVRLEDLPPQLPEFFRERVREVLLDEVDVRDSEGQVPDSERLQALAAQFPNLTSLDIRDGQWEAGLAQRAARAWPRLSALGLRDLANPVSLQDLRALASLPRLRRLTLRGSRLGEMPVTALNGLTLDYLGLDLLDLDAWPQWLDNVALDRLGEVSLVGNRLSEVPSLILADGQRVARPIRVWLHGNRFAWQALLDMALAQRFQGRFIFDLDLSAQMVDALYQRVLERAQLQVVLQNWAEPVQGAVRLAPEHVSYRQRLSRVLLDWWRESLRDNPALPLSLEDLVLQDFPGNMPAFFPGRVRQLDLTRFSGDAERLEQFLGQFPYLQGLTLAQGEPALTRVPRVLESFPQLRDLSLADNGLTIDQAAMDSLARLPALSSLRLDGNVLGQIDDLSAFDQRFLGYLGLARMDISTWPAWLDGFLPNGLERLGLDGNQLTTLPAHLLENPRSPTGAVDISLQDNPLSRDTLIQAHLSQHPSRPYTFNLDLPEDIAAMQREEHVSDTEDPDSPDPQAHPADESRDWNVLLERFNQLQMQDLNASDALQTLYRRGMSTTLITQRLEQALAERLQLEERLRQWHQEIAGQVPSETRLRSRERIALALWDHWQRNVLPELGRPESPLVLWQVQLIDLPVDLPASFAERVRAVLLDDAIQREGTAFEAIIGEPELQAFARRFPNLHSLDIRGGHWGVGLAQMVARAWPQLGSLGLRELGGMFGHQDFRALLGMPRLRHLELRGSRVRDMPASALHGAMLEYLGLDWTDLQEWPQWLDIQALQFIGELSLVGNQLSEVPPAILGDLTPVGRPLRIHAQGNQFRHQALLDMMLAERFHRRLVFELDLSPAIADVLNQRVLERAQLQAALQVWIDTAPLSEPLLPGLEHMNYRQRIARELLAFWREEVRGGGTALLSLDDVVLDDFPGNLPPFFAARVYRLDLSRFDAQPQILERFVRQFPHLRELSLVRGGPLDAVPAFIEGFSELRELALVHMGMTIDQAALEAFARMPRLSSLQLDGNRLGEISDVSIFRERFFGFFSMARMNIDTWPAWLSEMLPNGIELLCLDDNLLSDLPVELLENRRTETGAVEISLRNNPLPRDILIRAHTSQHFNRPYSFTLDLPEDIAAMEHEAHTSDSEDAGSVLEDPTLSDDDPASTWETGDLAQDDRHQQLWERLESRGDAGSLLALIGLLRHSADYRSLVTRSELVERVWAVLSAAARDTGLRQTLNGMAEEPVQQLHGHETCPDGIRLEFNQMEFQVHTHQALSEVTDENRGPALFRLMRGIFRSTTLDRLAREQANGRDEAEVRLAYRLRWAEQLELPLPPRSMLYRGAANIAPGELDQALLRLQVEESGQGLMTFASQCDFWVVYLREAFAARFKLLKDTYEAQVLSAIDLYPDETAEQSSARIRALEDKFKRDEQALIEHLTLQQAMGGR
ncbi:MAG: hypothetical protein LBJ37_00090 [Paucimonas sp.]|jgi:Leucine-rich repeat (LRR) protein|nr:hypothetical protein [Paucimonas sp.]